MHFGQGEVPGCRRKQPEVVVGGADTGGRRRPDHDRSAGIRAHLLVHERGVVPGPGAEPTTRCRRQRERQALRLVLRHQVPADSSERLQIGQRLVRLSRLGVDERQHRLDNRIAIQRLPDHVLEHRLETHEFVALPPRPHHERAVKADDELVVALGHLQAPSSHRLRVLDVARQQRHHGPDVEQPRSFERVHRPGVPRLEPGQLLVDRIHIALGQQLADSPHVTVQREELVADVVGDFSELRCGGKALGGRIDAPQHVHAVTKCVAECKTVSETPRHGDRLRAQLQRPFENSRSRHPRRRDRDQPELPGDPRGRCESSRGNATRASSNNSICSSWASTTPR